MESDKRGRNALHYAAHSGDLITIRLLLEHSNDRELERSLAYHARYCLLKAHSAHSHFAPLLNTTHLMCQTSAHGSCYVAIRTI